MSRRQAMTNARVAAWSILALLATAAVEPILAEGPGASSAPSATGALRALVDANVATLALPEPIEKLGLDAAGIRLAIGAGAPKPPASVEGDAPGSRLVRLTYEEGAASDDAASLVLPDGTTLPAQVVTPPGVLPSPRFAARTVGPEGTAYLLGGATSDRVASLEWRPLDAILRVDLASGRIATMHARLPSPRYDAALAWDPRPGAGCSGGCVYAFGGTGPEGAPLDEILRYDPARDALDILDARLPIAASGLVALFDGERAHLLGGEQPAIFRFDPRTSTLDVVGASPLTDLAGLAGAFDPGTSAACPAGCGYLFGGAAPVTRYAAPAGFETPLDQTRANVLRYDASTGVVMPLAALMPEPRQSPGVAWDGSRAILVGGGGCAAALICQYPASVLAFDPDTSAFQTLDAALDPPMREAALALHDGEAVIVAGVVGTASASEVLDRLVRVDVG